VDPVFRRTSEAMKITQVRFYHGARERVCRLGLADPLLELEDILLSTDVRLGEKMNVSNAATLRRLIDGALEAHSGWERTSVAGVDWIKKRLYAQSFLSRLGVELQVSARSARSTADIANLRREIITGLIDVGVVVVPDDRLQGFLPDKTPTFSDAVTYIDEQFREAMKCSFVVIAVEHDGPSEAPLKQRRKL
jgi:hypothetical protein